MDTYFVYYGWKCISWVGKCTFRWKLFFLYDCTLLYVGKDVFGDCKMASHNTRSQGKWNGCRIMLQATRDKRLHQSLSWCTLESRPEDMTIDCCWCQKLQWCKLTLYSCSCPLCPHSLLCHDPEWNASHHLPGVTLPFLWPINPYYFPEETLSPPSLSDCLTLPYWNHPWLLTPGVQSLIWINSQNFPLASSQWNYLEGRIGGW